MIRKFNIKSFLLILIISSANILEANDKNHVLKENRKIVFLGNSITEFWPKYTNFFSINELYINKGISGQTTIQMLKRFQTISLRKLVRVSKSYLKMTERNMKRLGKTSAYS